MNFKKLPITVEVEGQVDEQTTVETPEGEIQASEGDIIVRGVHGERYPVKPAIFAKTYLPDDSDDLDAWGFYDSLLPEGVEVYPEEDPEGEVYITGVAVPNPDDLSREEYDRAVEFARELSRAVGLKDPPLGDDADPEEEA
jgi:hypothetical protein